MRLRRCRVRHAGVLAASLLAIAASSSGADEPELRRKPTPLVSPQKLVEMIRSAGHAGAEAEVPGTTSGKLQLIDVREPEEYAEGHIPGAVNIPQQDFARRIGEIDTDALVIPYCNMDFRGFVAAEALRALGVERVALMQERGINGWREQGLPIAGPETGLTDTEALARLRELSPRELLGDRYVERVAPTGETHVIRMTASEWYFEPNDLEVNAGDELRFEITSEKGDHFFVQPNYEVAVALPQGETQVVRFIADQPGDFRFGSCEWDGASLQVMKGRLRVRSQMR
jgi:rhodanese-related sulfurtransferase/plastocyanin